MRQLDNLPMILINFRRSPVTMRSKEETPYQIKPKLSFKERVFPDYIEVCQIYKAPLTEVWIVQRQAGKLPTNIKLKHHI